MRTEVFDSASLPVGEWQALCDRDPDVTIFHHAAWSQLWERVHGNARAEWWVLTDDGGRWIGGAPVVRVSRFGITRLYSQPLGAYGGWVGERSGRAVEAVAGWMRRLMRPTLAEMVITPLRCDDEFAYPGQKIERERYVLDLSAHSKEDAWKADVRRDVARNLERATRHGWRIELVQNVGDVERTRGLWEQAYHHHRRKLNRTRWQFYQSLVEVFSPGQQLFWWTASDDRGPAATAIRLRSGDRFFLHDAAMDRLRKEERPIHALYETTIRTAFRLGCRVVDLGSCPAGAWGLALFKEGWGAVAEPYCEYHYRKAWWPRR